MSKVKVAAFFMTIIDSWEAVMTLALVLYMIFYPKKIEKTVIIDISENNCPKFRLLR